MNPSVILNHSPTKSFASNIKVQKDMGHSSSLNDDLNQGEQSALFYQPIGLKDRENMVQFSDDEEEIVIPECNNTQQQNERELEDFIAFHRKKKTDEFNYRHDVAMKLLLKIKEKKNQNKELDLCKQQQKFT